MSDTQAVNEDYLWALEILAHSSFATVDVSLDARKKARTIVANRTGIDAPYTIDLDQKNYYFGVEQ